MDRSQFVTAANGFQRQFRKMYGQDMEIWEYGFMKTTLEIPDGLFRLAKAKAALEGRKLKDVVADGLRLAVKEAPKAKKRHVKFPLVRAKGKKKLDIPSDAAFRVELEDDMRRYAASLR